MVKGGTMRNNALIRQSLSRFGEDGLLTRVATDKVVRLDTGAKHSRPAVESDKARVKLRPGLY
jgi:hypothetical protein